MRYLKLFENFILEGKIEDLQKQYSSKIDDYEIAMLTTYAENSSSNLQWLLKHYSNDKKNYKNNIGGINILLDVIEDYFKRYLRIKNNLPVSKRDINSISSTYELIKIIDEYNDYDDMLSDPGVKIIYADEKWIVYLPKTYEASNKWGWNRFCTSRDEDYFDFHNINHESLVYIMHKFDYTKNIAIECLPNGKYQMWNYQDDNSMGNIHSVRDELGDIDDGFLNIDIVVDNLPRIDEDDMIHHLSTLLYNRFDVDDINSIMNSNFEEKSIDDISEYIRDKNMNLYNLESDIHDSI